LFKRNCYEKILFLIFIVTLPLVNPWVRGDGVGYYAYGRALLVEHSFDFRNDWLHANTSFRAGRVDNQNRIGPDQFTSTGHIDNHFSIGPAILWCPGLVIAHTFVKIDHLFGGSIPADGFSLPYILAMALQTACYGFLGVLLSFKLAKRHLPDRAAFWGAIGIWFASSLPVYMYFNPAWSHALSAFTTALFFWYWDRTRADRTIGQWLLLGIISGLMMNVYYVCTVLLIVPLFESLAFYWRGILLKRWGSVEVLFFRNLAFLLAVFVAFLPTLITKKIVYGSYAKFGYGEKWFLSSPALLKVCFSSEHGLISWTPIVLLSLVGLVILFRYDRELSLSSIFGFSIYLYTIGCYQEWAGISSFGNRFFVSLTPIFVLGLATFFAGIALRSPVKFTTKLAPIINAVLIIWNMGLIFQWGTHLIPARGPISWAQTARNQFLVVPNVARLELESYMTRRKSLMDIIEKEDVDRGKGTQGERHGIEPN
jgi:hypothetical protein